MIIYADVHIIRQICKNEYNDSARHPPGLISVRRKQKITMKDHLASHPHGLMLL